MDITLKKAIEVPASTISKAKLAVLKGNFSLSSTGTSIVFNEVFIGVVIGETELALNMESSDLANTKPEDLIVAVQKFVQDHINDKGEVI